MKNNLLTIFIGLIIALNGFGQSSHPSFKLAPTNIEAIFSSNKNQKPVFLEAYLPTCGHCMAYNETFEHPILKNYLDEHFNAYQLDLSLKENQEFLKKRKIYVYSTPTFLVFSPNGDLWNFEAMGEENNSIEGIQNQLNKAISVEKRQSSLLKKYHSQALQNDELFEVGTYTRYTLDTLKTIQIVNELTKKLKEEEFESEFGFSIIQKLMMDESNPLFEYFIKNIKSYYKYADSVKVSQVAENVLMNSLYNPKSISYSEKKMEFLKKSLLDLGIPKQSVARRFIYFEVLRLLVQKNTNATIQHLKRFYLNQPIPTKERDFWCNTIKKYDSTRKDCPL